jgi:glycosyltransferase involved in cell wall biosynthesis
MATPKVTVLLPVYNASLFLKEAIESVLAQTFTDFELLIINDGSTDRSEEIILSYSDSRIRYEKNETNLRLIATLNKGIDLAKGEFIARMDADDICMPSRLEKQVAYMDANPDVGVLGTWVHTLGLEKDYQVRFKQGHDEIRFRLFLSNYIHHPTVLLRRSVLVDHNVKYGDYLHIEDYEMWVRMSKYCKIDILPEVLLQYRVHGQNISQLNKEFQQDYSAQIRKMQIDELQVNYTSIELDAYECFLKDIKFENADSFMHLSKFLNKLIKANNDKKVFSPIVFNSFFSKRFWDSITVNTKLGPSIYLAYKQSGFFNSMHNDNWSKTKLYVKCMLRI